MPLPHPAQNRRKDDEDRERDADYSERAGSVVHDHFINNDLSKKWCRKRHQLDHE